MNQEIVMMFNSDDVEKMAVTSAEGEVTPEGVIAVFYDEMQRSIQVDENAQIVVDPQQLQDSGELVAFKEGDCVNLVSEGISQEGDSTQLDQEPMLIDESNQHIAIAENHEEGMTEVKTEDMQNTWDISILENNDAVPENVEPLTESENQTCQLWECPKCTALFRDKDVCENHIERAHAFICGLCNEPFEEKENFELHIIKHISEVPGHILQKIDAVDEDMNANEEPQKDENNVVPMGNGEASSSEKQNEAVADSTETTSLNDESVSKKSPHVCSVCSKDCFTNNSLLLHMKKKHSNFVSKDHICDECGKRFRWKLSLENHKTIHHKRNNLELTVFSCHVCGEEYTTSVDLDKHLSTHEETNQITCDFCGLRFKTSGNLLNHIKASHPDGQEYTCKNCPKSFKTKTHLEAHVSEVHNVKELTKCRFCQKMFESADDMSNHVRTFHLRKPQKFFDCDYCPQSFASTKELSQHLEIHLSTLQKFE